MGLRRGAQGRTVQLWGTTGRGLGGSHTPPHSPWTPPPLKHLGQIFLRAFGRSKIISGAFGPNWFRPKNFFGAFGASKKLSTTGGEVGWTQPPHSPKTQPPPPKKSPGKG